MSGATDSGMMKTMGWVMGIIAVFAIIIGVMSNMLAGDSGAGDPAFMRNALIKRIEPVASVRTVAEEQPAATAVASAPKSGEELVNGACAACHAAGVAGAPKLDDEAIWASRREAGLEALVASVINGKGSMPARGGSAYSDEEITAAVKHMAMFESSDNDQSAAEESESVSEETAAINEESPQEDTKESAESAAGSETDSEPEAAPADSTAGDAEDGASNSATTTTESAPAVAKATAVAVMGQSPEGLTDSIKTTVDTVCSGCHLAGVANAPKLGDAAAWQPRMAKGMDVLVSSVANGLNVMPPRGGSTLTDDEIPVAIQYLLSK